MTPSEANVAMGDGPSIEKLHESLEAAQTSLICADMIDNGTRRRTEMDYWKGRVTSLKAKIAEMEGK